MLSLGKSDIETLFDLDAGAAAVRDAYIAQAESRVQTPDVTHLGFEDAEGECHVKSGHIAGTEGFVIKIATGFYRNPAKGLPSSNGMNLLFSAEDGQTLAMLNDEGWLTDIRTGLGGALATQALMRANAERVLIVGTGLQARHQARCLNHLCADQGLTFVIGGRDLDRARACQADLMAEGLSVEVASSLPDVCGVVDAIITTTPARSPVILSDWVRAGTHITAIGADSPGKQELDVDLVRRANVLVCDLAAQSLAHGEFQAAHAAGALEASKVIALGSILSGAHPGRETEDQITIADLTGLAAQDAAASLVVYRAAQQQSR